MKLSKNKINEYIQLYLNDLEDFGDNQADSMIAESTLNFSFILSTPTSHSLRNLF